MQDLASELRRILLPRTTVNKGKKKGGSPDPYSAGATYTAKATYT
jgi:hypothetical protein